MVQTEATLIQKESIAPAWWRITLAAPELAAPLQPGQFILLRCGDLFSCYLRRPILPQDAGDQRLSFLLRPDPDPGLAWLAARQVGDKLDLIGPLGSGFELPELAQNLLLISDGQQISPLLGQLERAIAAGRSVTLALGGHRAASLYPVAGLPPQVEFQAATLDGSLGHHGPITDLLPELLRWADQVCAAGSPGLYRAIKSQAQITRFTNQTGFSYGLILPRLLPCGLGACYGCAIQTQAGFRLICTAGPVFDLAEIGLEEIGGD
jgi:dihydroorotate dehydrogenase electron transfer subunit